MDEKIKEYQEGILAELEDAKEELQTLKELDIKSDKDYERIEELKKFIAVATEFLKVFEAWNLIPTIKANVNKLSSDMTEDINQFVESIFFDITTISSSIITALKIKGVKISNYYELEQLAQDLDSETAIFGEINEVLKYHHFIIGPLKNQLFSLTENLLSDEKKNNINENIKNMLDDYDSKLYEAIEAIMEQNITKEKTSKLKQILSSVLASLNRHKGKIITGIAGLTIFGVVLASCQKEDTKNNSHNETTEPYGTESTYESTEDTLATEITFDTTPTEEVTEPTVNPIVESLQAKGYDEQTAEIMAYNLSEDAIETLLNEDYNPIYASYASIPGFTPSYTDDYEEIRMLYDNIPEFKVVDFVNRGHKIMETGFYTDVLLSDVVDSLIIIDSDQMHRPENAPVAQNIMVACNKIVDNYLFGTSSEDDINKLEAYKYFAEEGSDLDNFLTRLSTLIQNILRNPNDEKAKDELYQFYYIFATSIHGFTNEKDALTNNPDFNEDAIVNSYYTYYVGYRYFIEGIMAIGHPISIETEDNIEEITKWEDLKYLIETAFQGPEFEALCGQSRTLGGE